MVEIGKALRTVLDDEVNDFFFTLRSSLTWDVGLFATLEAAVYETLVELRGRRDVPRWIAGFFMNYLGAAVGIGQRADLLVVRDGVEVPDGSDVVSSACARIKDYQHWLEADELPFGSSVVYPRLD